MSSPIERLSQLVIGTVESVAPDQIHVLLDLDAPNTTALNTGYPTPFPRLNSYVLVPNEAGATVGYISWIGIERSPYPKRSGLKDFGLIDLPFPLRKMTIAPIGTLTAVPSRSSVQYELSRGVTAFPSVGDQVLLPTPDQIAAIVGAKKSDRRVCIGASPMAANSKIMVDPDKIFGRHLAVLGNTGSGKSCSVAGLIRWSLEAAKDVREGENSAPNARFIILDPNGEYAHAFKGMESTVRHFCISSVTEEAQEKKLDVPAWLWNGKEWSAAAHAQPGVQRPLLMQGLRDLKSGHSGGIPRDAQIARHLSSYKIGLISFLDKDIPTLEWKYHQDIGHSLECLIADMHYFESSVAGNLHDKIHEYITIFSTLLYSRKKDDKKGGYNYKKFNISDLERIRDGLDSIIKIIPDFIYPGGINEDTPVFFDVNGLSDYLDKIAQNGRTNAAGFISTLGIRIRGMLEDERLKNIIASNPPTDLDRWLTNYIGGNNAENGQIAIIDLSLVPSEIIHIVIAVLSRAIFEALQRYRRSNADGHTLPTVLVLEEAHTFIRQGKNEEDGPTSPATLCRQSFEKIAREGRKFGLGLVLSSQRPSELSPTVLSQCNTFLLHRLVNDEDQKLVSKLVPDNVGGLLRELPSLPSRQAILLGWATPIPMLVDIRELPDSQRPASDDPDFWDVWRHKKEREVNWADIAHEWTASHSAEPTAAPAQDLPQAEDVSYQQSDACTSPEGGLDDEIPF